MSSTDNAQPNPIKILKQLEPLLTPAHASWSIGFALLDRTFRYRFVNDALAVMNRLSVKAHIGAPLRTILADTAAKVEPVFEQVFSTGKAVLHYEFSGGLPTRKEKAFWMVSYFPVFAAPSNVSQVAAMVLDMTILRRLEKRFAELLGFRSLQSLPEPEEVPDSLDLSRLSDREAQILRLLVNGNSNKQAAAVLGISVRTVESHRARIMLKLKAGFAAGIGALRYPHKHARDVTSSHLLRDRIGFCERNLSNRRCPSTFTLIPHGVTYPLSCRWWALPAFITYRSDSHHRQRASARVEIAIRFCSTSQSVCQAAFVSSNV